MPKLREVVSATDLQATIIMDLMDLMDLMDPMDPMDPMDLTGLITDLTITALVMRDHRPIHSTPAGVVDHSVVTARSLEEMFPAAVVKPLPPRPHRSASATKLSPDSR